MCPRQSGSITSTVSAMPAPEPAPHGPLCSTFPQNATHWPPSRHVDKTVVTHILPNGLPKKPSLPRYGLPGSRPAMLLMRCVW